MSSSRLYLHLKAAAFSEMKVDDNAMDVTTFHLALLYFLLIRDFPTPQHSIRLLLFPYIEDFHPNGGIKKFKSSVYSNFIFSFRLNQNWFPNPIVLKVMSLIQQGEMALSANRFQRLREVARGHLSRLQGICFFVYLHKVIIKTSSSSHLSESGSKAADPVGTSPEPTTKKPMRCTNLECRRYSGSQLSFSPAVIYHIFIVYASSLIIVRLIRSLYMQIFGL
ncbi:hypothetical protein Bca52824_072067 [Brassica carinata]|uniref:Uncharacterized protein n=1 Tax=Brassica carinata TaxID=52824 RepID=A0A8X7Q8K5_BRACI|nr:hypothetical protein Bca52824_072067 [Brassica carinata]